MRSVPLLFILTFACKPVPVDLGGDPEDPSTGTTSGANTGSIDANSEGSDGADTVSTWVTGGSSGSTTGGTDGSGASSTGEPPGELEGPCRPNRADECSGGAICCSDDPATVGGKTPNYFQDGVVDEEFGAPLFSNDNNELGSYGQCIVVGGFSTPMKNLCPVPCNPTWSAERVSALCGQGSTCCQTRELDPEKDCVLDPQTQRWRAVDGHDIGTPLTTWGDQHATNQDPFGTACEQLASDGGGEPDPDALADCYAQLSVADQRGFCRFAPTCPCTEDLCDMKNADWVPRCP